MGRKSKCSKELKLSIVKSYLNKDGSYEILAKEANVHFTTVRKWIKKYVAFGESAFDSTNTNASYTKEFKEHVVLDYLNGAGAYIDLAVKYKIPSNSTKRLKLVHKSVMKQKKNYVNSLKKRVSIS